MKLEKGEFTHTNTYVYKKFQDNKLNTFRSRSTNIGTAILNRNSFVIGVLLHIDWLINLQNFIIYLTCCKHRYYRNLRPCDFSPLCLNLAFLPAEHLRYPYFLCEELLLYPEFRYSHIRCRQPDRRSTCQYEFIKIANRIPKARSFYTNASIDI